MHSRLCIDSLEIHQKYVNILYPSLELLKSIEVIDYINKKYNIFETQLKQLSIKIKRNFFNFQRDSINC